MNNPGIKEYVKEFKDHLIRKLLLENEHKRQNVEKSKKDAIKQERVIREFLGRYKDVDKIIYSNPATVVILKNGNKGIVKLMPSDTWDYEKGFLYAYIKALKGSRRLSDGDAYVKKVVGIVDHLNKFSNCWSLDGLARC